MGGRRQGAPLAWSVHLDTVHSKRQMRAAAPQRHRAMMSSCHRNAFEARSQLPHGLLVVSPLCRLWQVAIRRLLDVRLVRTRARARDTRVALPRAASTRCCSPDRVRE